MASRIKEVKAALQDDILRLVKELVPGGKQRGNNYSARSPVRQDRKPGSFVVWVGGNAKGAFKDFAAPEDAGDVIGLICLTKGLDRKGALAWAEDWLGWKSMSKAEKAKFMKQVEKRQKQAKQEEAAQNRRLVDWARRTWSTTHPIEGTLGEVYFEHRGIPLKEIPNRTDFCHFLPEAEYWFEAEYEYVDGKWRKVKPGPKFPAIVSRMDDITGQLQALHYTFIAPDGKGKAPVEDPTKAKLMFPRTSGAAIWMTRGARNLDPVALVNAGIRVPGLIGEGIEDGLTIGRAVPELMCMAAGSLPNLLYFPLHRCFDSFLLLKDNDWGKPQAQELFDKCVERMERHGFPVACVSSSEGKDFNDLVRGEG